MLFSKRRCGLPSPAKVRASRIKPTITDLRAHMIAYYLLIADAKQRACVLRIYSCPALFGWALRAAIGASDREESISLHYRKGKPKRR